MGMGGRGEAPKVMCLFGSESGTAKRGCQKLSQKLKAQGIEVLTVAEANSAAGELANLKEKCDVLVIATSSYGEGDPPDNFARFLLALKKATDAGEKPLAGMQHAVLGYGASCYETYQNVPRLTDKYLGEAGSRRFVRRQEVDAAHYIEGDQHIKDRTHFREAVFEALQALPSASAPPVCAWDEARVSHSFPTSIVTAKSAEDLAEFKLGSTSGATNEQAFGMLFWGIPMAIGVIYGYYVRWYSEGAGGA